MAKRLVALCGYTGVGKDEIAKFLCEEYGWLRVSFADPMRRALISLNPWICTQPGVFYRLTDLVDDYGWDFIKRNYAEVRELLQRMGTEAGREVHGAECWVDIACDRIYEETGSVVVTDLRFPNELDMIRQLDGTVVHVIRPGAGKVNEHLSEQMNYAAAASITIVNDGNLMELYRCAASVLGLTDDVL